MLGKHSEKVYSFLYEKIANENRVNDFSECYKQKSNSDRCFEQQISKFEGKDANIKTKIKEIKDAIVSEAGNIGYNTIVDCIDDGLGKNVCFQNAKDKLTQKGLPYKPEMIRKDVAGKKSLQLYQTCQEMKNEDQKCIYDSDTDKECLNFAIKSAMETKMFNTITEVYNAIQSVRRREMHEGKLEIMCDTPPKQSKRELQEVKQEAFSSLLSACDDEGDSTEFEFCLENAKEKFSIDDDQWKDAINFQQQKAAASFALDRIMDQCDDSVSDCFQQQENICRKYIGDKDIHSGKCWLWMKREKIRRAIETCKAIESDTFSVKKCAKFIKEEIPEMAEEPENDPDYLDIFDNIDANLQFQETNRIQIKLNLRDFASVDKTLHKKRLLQLMNSIKHSEGISITCGLATHSDTDCYLSCVINFPSFLHLKLMRKVFEDFKHLMETSYPFDHANLRNSKRRLGESEYESYLVSQGITDHGEVEQYSDDTRITGEMSLSSASIQTPKVVLALFT